MVWRGIKSAGWRAGKVGRSDIVKCIITAVNSDGTYDVRRAGIADDTADIKNVASIAKIESFAVGDIASLGFAEGDRQKPFLYGFVAGGGKHVEIIVNPLPTPVFGEPAIPYISPTGTKWGTLLNSASYRRLTEFPLYGDTIGMVTRVTYGIKWYGYEFSGTTQYVTVGTGYPQEWNIMFSQNGTTHVFQNQWDYISAQITDYVSSDTDTFIKGYFDDFPLSGGFDSSAFNLFAQQYKDYYNNYW